MARTAFGFALGFVAGVAGVLAFQRIQRKGVVETAESLAEEVGDKVKALEAQIAAATAPARRRSRKATA